MKDDLVELQRLAHEAAPLLGIATSYGHGPSRDGLRVAGFYYKADDAMKHSVLPAHCLSAMRDLVVALTSTREGLTGGDDLEGCEALSREEFNAKMQRRRILVKNTDTGGEE